MNVKHVGFLDAQTVKPTQFTWLARRMLGLVQECKLWAFLPSSATGNSKLAMVGVFTLQKWARASDQGFPPRVVVKHWPAHCCWIHWRTSFSGFHARLWGYPCLAFCLLCSWYSMSGGQRELFLVLPLSSHLHSSFRLTSVHFPWYLNSSLCANEPRSCFRLFRSLSIFWGGRGVSFQHAL